MPKAKLQAATVGGSPDDIETTFYEALQTGNIERLMACWADEDEVVCVHPGGQRLVGAAAIRASFETLFATARCKPSPCKCAKWNRWPVPCTICWKSWT